MPANLPGFALPRNHHPPGREKKKICVLFEKRTKNFYLLAVPQAPPLRENRQNSFFASSQKSAEKLTR
jgi:hypothetical protein